MTISYSDRSASALLNTGATLVALAGLGLAGYGLLILLRSVSGFPEPGLSPDHLGMPPGEIQVLSQDLYNYIIHVQMANAGFMTGLGLAVTALALFGIRRSARWSLWAAVLSTVVSLAIALPLHYPFGLDTLGHLGPVYVVLAFLLAGMVVSHRAMNR